MNWVGKQGEMCGPLFITCASFLSCRRDDIRFPQPGDSRSTYTFPVGISHFFCLKEVEVR